MALLMESYVVNLFTWLSSNAGGGRPSTPMPTCWNKRLEVINQLHYLGIQDAPLSLYYSLMR